jgi:hypothetical protein
MDQMIIEGKYKQHDENLLHMLETIALRNKGFDKFSCVKGKQENQTNFYINKKRSEKTRLL